MPEIRGCGPSRHSVAGAGGGIPSWPFHTQWLWLFLGLWLPLSLCLPIPFSSVCLSLPQLLPPLSYRSACGAWDPLL